MARMYSRARGKSGSKKPARTIKQAWQKHGSDEVKQLVIKLGKAEHGASMIGLILRDSYGIPDVRSITKLSITQILNENKLNKAIPEDMLALIKRDIDIAKHLETNKKDMPAKRGLRLTESKIKRLEKYYKRIGRLDSEWKYDRSKAKILLE
jgi:small subunit ribosomal protein S15